ncbi:sce7726 family protein [Lachnospiraceae bacterium 62-35]
MLYDKDIREPLFDFLEERYGKVRIIEEKQVGRSRADVVMVRPSSLTGVEIKSDADTYARLARQVKDYDRYFDYNYVVAGSSHGCHIKEHVPKWWGIITVEQAEDGLDFYMLREAEKNLNKVPRAKLGLLWRPELAHIQEINQMPKYKEKSKAFVIDKILLKVPEAQVDEQVSQELFERDYTKIAETIKEYKQMQRKRSFSKAKVLRRKKERK